MEGLLFTVNAFACTGTSREYASYVNCEQPCEQYIPESATSTVSFSYILFSIHMAHNVSAKSVSLTLQIKIQD